MMITLPKQVRWWEIPITKAPSLKKILKWCRAIQGADTLLFSVRLANYTSNIEVLDKEVESNVYNLFRSYIREDFKAIGWPGTKLLYGFTHIFIIDYNIKVEKILLRTEQHLFKWVHSHKKKLPEDICLFKSGRMYPSFISVTHEKDAWLLSETERPPLPGLKLVTLDESFLFDGPYFCTAKKKQKGTFNVNEKSRGTWTSPPAMMHIRRLFLIPRGPRSIAWATLPRLPFSNLG